MGTTLTIVPNDVVRRFVFVPDGFEQRRPENSFEAIKRARAVIADEARWTQGTEHRGLNGKDDPFCGSWRACAIGAVGLVTIGLVNANTDPSSDWCSWGYGLDEIRPHDNEDPEEQKYAGIYRQSIDLLDRVARVKHGQGIVGVNDRDSYGWSSKAQTRQDVLDIFQHAYKIAKLFIE